MDKNKSVDEDLLELDALQAELEQNAKSLEEDFASYASEKIDPKLEELFFTDKKAFILEILKIQNEFLDNGIRAKSQRAKELGDNITKKQALGEIEKAEKEFSKNNPDVDVDAMLIFYEEELSPKAKASLDALAPSEFFVALYELYSQATTPKEQEQELPKKIEGVPASTEMTHENNSDMMFDRL